MTRLDAALADVLARITAVSPTPSPFPEYTGDPNLVTPGVVGFIAIAAVAIITVLLLIDMTRRVRRVRYRSEVREQIAAEQAEAANGGAPTAEGDPRAPGDSSPR